LIFDGGSGLRRLGNALAQEQPAGGRAIPFFLTHFHWDHIQGIPFFQPIFDSRNRITIHSMLAEARQVLDRAMSRPFFPLDFEAFSAEKKYLQMEKDPVEYFGLTVRPFPMRHPQGAIGYRIENQGASIVYASDLEHGDPYYDKVLRENVREADVLIYDAQYTPEEYCGKEGWGHSTWLEASRVARDAGVKRLLLIHHDPEHDDGEMRRIVDLTRAEFEATDAASEGLTVRL
jgi:phosphoribosyl 1,2-cyclic phosphodiesterase